MTTTFDTLDREGCIERWKKQFGRSPPKYASIEFMRNVFAYEAQVRAMGGYPRAVRHVLKQCLTEPQDKAPKAGSKPIPSPAALCPGMHLVRGWNGRAYHVEVTADGFEMGGSTIACTAL